MDLHFWGFEIFNSPLHLNTSFRTNNHKKSKSRAK